MVDAYKTEEEQLEELKAWFRDNGRHLITAVLIVAVAAFGIYSWRQREQHRSEAASVEFQDMMQAINDADNGIGKTEDRRAAARHFAEMLKSNYASSAYAQFAALFEARFAVEDNDLAQARTQLQWVLAHKPAKDVRALTRLRLARVLHAQGDDKAALAQLDEAQAGGYAGAYQQLKGDIEYARGDIEAARASYQRAQAFEKKMSPPVNDPVLEMKLRDLQVAPAAAASAKEPSAKAPSTKARGAS